MSNMTLFSEIPALITLNDACRQCGLSRHLLRQAIDDELLPAIILPGKREAVRIDQRDFDAFLQRVKKVQKDPASPIAYPDN